MKDKSEIVEDVKLAEAAAWLARLQGPARTTASEAAFKAWLASDSAHSRAFTRVTDTWEIIPGAARAMPRLRRKHRHIVPIALAASLGLLTSVFIILALVPSGRAFQTAVGEQKTITLPDGSRIALNTNSQLVVDYSGAERHINLQRGEALFEVAKDKSRPFVVQAGNERVRAVGTKFVVRKESKNFSVVLLEGKVTLSASSGMTPSKSKLTALEPGDRVSLNGEMFATLDRPALDSVTAWQRGEAIFDNATLGDAIAELNRYGQEKISLEDSSLAELRISGVFTTRDPREFARAVAQLHGLQVEERSKRIALKH